MRFTNVLVLCLPLVLTGCSLTPAITPTSERSVNGTAIRGIVHGARQPIAGAHVYLYAAGSGGYGTTSTSLLTSSVAVHNPGFYGVDGSSNYYVITDSNGNFSISSDYSCASGAGVYLYSVGGDSGNGANSTIGLMAVLGACPAAGNFASATPYVVVNEVSTIAAAYAMSGFATDATHISSSGTTLALTGVQNAFANAANLASISTGQALATTPASDGSNIGTVPQATINTLADILAACINSSGSTSTACSTLFSNAMSAGSTGTTATDTATAAIYMAHNPGANITALYGIGGASGPFEPTLNSQPNDFTIALSFTGFGLSEPGWPQGIAIDASGNAWVANAAGNSVSELTSLGTVSTGSPFTDGGLNTPISIAIDGTGNAWVANEYPYSTGITELTSAGTAVNGSPFTGGDLNEPEGIAIDGLGNAWAANYGGTCGPCTYYVTMLTSAGVATGYTGGGMSGPHGVAVDGSGNAWVGNLFNASISKFNNSGSGSSYSGGGLDWPQGIAIDHLGNVWVANYFSNGVSEFTNAGTAVGTGYTGGGLNGPYGIAIDGSGNVWVANNGGSITEINSSGAAISGSSGYTGGVVYTPGSIAIDGSGNVWVTNYNGANGSSVSEFIGAATPVITPIAAGLPATPTVNGSSNLGTRP
jgi:hypothetical protein